MRLHTEQQCKEKLEGIKLLLESNLAMVNELIYEFEDNKIELQHSTDNHYEKLKEFTEKLYDGVPPE